MGPPPEAAVAASFLARCIYQCFLASVPVSGIDGLDFVAKNAAAVQAVVEPVAEKVIELPFLVAVIHAWVGVGVAGIQAVMALKGQHLGDVDIVIGTNLHVQ